MILPTNQCLLTFQAKQILCKLSFLKSWHQGEKYHETEWKIGVAIVEELGDGENQSKFHKKGFLFLEGDTSLWERRLGFHS